MPKKRTLNNQQLAIKMNKPQYFLSQLSQFNQ